MVKRAQIHKLLKDLPDDELPSVELFIKFLMTRDQMFLTLAAAPWEDEVITEEEEAAVEEAREEVRQGKVVSDEEMWHQLGHKPRKANPSKHARAS